MSTKQAQIEQKCNQLVGYALEKVGSHYLTGAAGSIPDMPNPVLPKRTIKMYPVMDPDPWDEPYPAKPLAVKRREDPVGRLRYLPIIEAAWSTINPKAPPQVCAGRCDQGVVKVLPKCSVDNPNKLQMEWNAYQNYRWPRPLGALSAEKDLVWGESCWGVYHFDCIGLVNWCLARLLSAEIGLDIAQVCNKKRVKVKNAKGKTETQLEDKDLGFFDEVDKPFSDYRVGDVLCRLAVPGEGDHIAFVTSGGTVEASSTSTGVITRNDRKGKWNFHMRLSNLVFKKYLGIK